MPERFKVVLDHARRYTSARLYLYLYNIHQVPPVEMVAGSVLSLEVRALIEQGLTSHQTLIGHIGDRFLRVK